MKTSFNRHWHHCHNWYRCVLFSTLTVLTGVYSVSINSQTKPVAAASSRQVDISAEPEKFTSRNITDNEISNPDLQDGDYIKMGDNSVIMLPEFRQKTIRITQGRTASTLSGSALTGPEIEKLKTDINALQEKAAVILPAALNVSKNPYRDIIGVFKAEGPEVILDDRQIDALSDFHGIEPVIRYGEIGSIEADVPGDENSKMDETENMIKITPDSENISLKSGLAGENLTTYQPSGWDNRIVISSVTGTHTSTAPFFNNQTLYVDWAVTNNGTTAITATFYTRLYIDGTLKNTWYTSGLDVGKWASVSDYNIGILTSGTHQIKIQTDVTGVIAETNESDNEYTRTITVYPYVNLTTYQPAGWDSRIVLSTVSGTNTSDPQIFDTDNIYLDWSIINNSSNSTTTTFYIDLYIDGTWKAAWTRAGLSANTFTTQLDYLVGKLSAGSHTFQIRIDMDGYVPEYNETDNEYSRTITVVNKNLLPYQPSGWDNKLVISTVTGTHSSASAFYNNQDLYVDFAVVNNGSAAITETFHSKIYVDGVVTNTYYTAGLNSNYWAYVQDINIGKLAIGNHTVRIVTDSDAEVAETNEADNSYSRTFYVGPSYNLVPYQPSGWDNRLVLSTETGTNTSSSVFYDTQNIYADWACLNNGLNDFTTTFYIRLYVDGTAVAAWTKAGLNHNTYTWGVDGNLGKLTAGTHNIKVVVDSDGDVAESDESDNEYTRTITVINKNLLPYQPSAWDNRIVLSTVTGTNTSASSICENQFLYLDYSIINNGSASITETFYVRLFIDGTTKATWTRSGIGANTYYTIQDFAIGTLAAGSHTARIVADVLDNVDETSESDNEYTLTFNVSTCKNITPYQPPTWDNKLVLSTVAGTNTSATTFYTDQDILVDWANISNGTANITETFTVKLYVDGVLKSTWTANGLNAGVYLYKSDFNAGKLTAGDHTFKIVADADNNVVETNESDNEHSRTITVVPAPYLNVSSATLSVGYQEGSTATFNITSNVSWTASASATWLTLNRESGSGDATITVTAQKNPTTSSRTATITVSGTGVANKTVTVTQEAAPASLDVSPGTLTVGFPEGSTGNFNITSNISWTASGSASWITLSKTNGSGDATITVTAQKNPSAASRTATITVSGTGVASKTVTVTQEAAPASLEVSSATLSVTYQEGSTGTFNITSNISWTASGSATWFILSSTGGSGDATIIVTAQKNPTTSVRTATVTLSGTGVANKTVTVNQDGAPTGFDETSDSHIKIYPNPASSILFFEGIPLNTTIFIYDINGKLCSAGILREDRIDISGLLSGVYTIIFEDDNNRYTHRFVKK